MSEINDGGPAFPHFKEDAWGNARVVGGMSLRDWFAGQALTGWISRPETQPGSSPRTFAETAYEIADAMLKARENSP